MRELINLLEKKERRILWFMGILIGLSLLFWFFVAQREKNSYFNSQIELTSLRTSAEKAKNESREKQIEWIQWKEAQTDFKKLRNRYVYQGEEALKNIRLDLQAILTKTGVEYSQIKYDYDYNEDAKINEVTITFTMKGSYIALKQFIHEVEQFPRFLALESIDFSDIDPQTGILTLKISLNGYYAN
ncbi:MAG: type 4a pilus biogenesis protein PilO [Candidatus Aminicenantes bacterium]|nr:type 4a pilus biogenesis protein PilO [Candidatus Aminicenantes bacterium]